MNLSKPIQGIVSGLAGSGAFVAFLFPIDASFPLSLGVSVVSFGATYLVLSSLSKDEINTELPKRTEEFYRQKFEEGFDTLQQIKLEVSKISNESIQQKAIEVVQVSHKIFENLQDDLQNIKSVRKFFSEHLSSTFKILKNYNEISKQNLKSESFSLLISRVENDMTKRVEAFHRILEKTLEDKLLDLDAELKQSSRAIEDELNKELKILSKISKNEQKMEDDFIEE